MADLTPQQKKQVQQAVDAAKAGLYRQALDAIDGIHHPQVDRLRLTIVKAYRAQIAKDVAPASFEEAFTPSEPILLLEEEDQPQPESRPESPIKGNRKHPRWKFWLR